MINMSKDFSSLANCATKWTKSAAECYFIGCNCDKCYIRKVIESKCVMRKVVLELVKKYGVPSEKLIEGNGDVPQEEEQERYFIYS